MAGLVLQNDGVILAGQVQDSLARDPSLPQNLRVQIPHCHPAAGRNLPLPDVGLDRVHNVRKALRPLHRPLKEGVGTGGKMAVGIDEGRHEGPALQADLLRPGCLPFKLRLRSDAPNSPVLHQKGVPPLARIHGENGSSAIQFFLHPAVSSLLYGNAART